MKRTSQEVSQVRHNKNPKLRGRAKLPAEEKSAREKLAPSLRRLVGNKDKAGVERLQILLDRWQEQLRSLPSLSQNKQPSQTDEAFLKWLKQGANFTESTHHELLAIHATIKLPMSAWVIILQAAISMKAEPEDVVSWAAHLAIPDHIQEWANGDIPDWRTDEIEAEAKAKGGKQ